MPMHKPSGTVQRSYQQGYTKQNVWSDGPKTTALAAQVLFHGLQLVYNPNKDDLRGSERLTPLHTAYASAGMVPMHQELPRGCNSSGAATRLHRCHCCISHALRPFLASCSLCPQEGLTPKERLLRRKEAERLRRIRELNGGMQVCPDPYINTIVVRDCARKIDASSQAPEVSAKDVSSPVQGQSCTRLRP